MTRLRREIVSRDIKFRVWKISENSYLDVEAWVLDYNGRVIDYTDGVSHQEDYIVERYTGLKDIDGVEIFEGDIFEGGDYQFDCVKFQDGKYTINLRGCRSYDLADFYDMDSTPPRVIGNKLENPNL